MSIIEEIAANAIRSGANAAIAVLNRHLDGFGMHAKEQCGRIFSESERAAIYGS